MGSLYDDDFLGRLQKGAQSLLPRWGLSPHSQVELLTISENATFKAIDPARPDPVILRVHRPAYHSEAEILSELAWITALRQENILRTPAIIPTQDNELIEKFEDHGEWRHVVAFEFLPGDEPDPEGDLVAGFRTLGGISARLHHHAQDWQVPKDFTRKTWNFDTALGAQHLWGEWRAALGLTAEGKAVLEQLCTYLEQRLNAYGTGPDRFGLVHADLRLANLLVDGDTLGVIDFDDCGFSWFVYDFAAAISFLETSPTIPALQEAWIEGYREVAPLDETHVEMIPTFIMFRRLLLTAWIASHSETETAQWAGMEAYTEGTVDLARSYLRDNGVEC
ncbi:MAG: phosphotransferase [Mangrovicoccus sp.]|nr:phosphotransferase [Mangrovicoccus sp.]